MKWRHGFEARYTRQRWDREDGVAVRWLTAFDGTVRFRVYGADGAVLAALGVFDTVEDAMREADRRVVSLAHVVVRGNA